MKMAKLKLGAIADDKPVRLTIELPAALHRDLVAYAQALGRETGTVDSEPAKLIAPNAGAVHGDGSERSQRSRRANQPPTAGNG